MGDTKAAIRLGVQGGSEVKSELKSIGDTGSRSFDSIGQAGEAAARRAQQAFERSSRDIEAAQRAQANAAAKLSSLQPKTGLQMQIEAAAASGSRARGGARTAGGALAGDFEGSARRSAEAFREMIAEQDRAEAKARAIIASLNPLAAAQDRYNREIQETADLQQKGLLTADQAAARHRQLKDALDQEALGHVRAAEGAAQHRAAAIQLGYQVQDVFTQAAAGTNPFLIFAQQGPQIASAFAMMGGGASAAAKGTDEATSSLDQAKEALDATGQVSGVFKGKMAGVGAFLSGPWGAALLGAISIAGLFASSLLDGGEAAEKEKKKLEDLKRAKEELKQAAEAAQKTQRLEIMMRLESAQAAARETENIRKATAAKLQAAVADQAIADNAARVGIEGAGLAQSFARVRTAELQAELAQADADVRDSGRSVRAIEADLAKYKAKIATDPSFAVEDRFDTAELILQRRRIRGEISQTQLESGIEKLRRARLAELEVIQKQEEASRRKATRDAETVSSSAVAKMLRDVLPGVQVTSTTGGKHVDNSYHYKGQAIDFVPRGGMRSMTKAQVRQIFESRGLDIVELLGPGDKDHSDHFHVAWRKGKLALDDFNAAARVAEERQREIEAAIQDVTGAFDPAMVAANTYAQKLAAIGLGQASGGISPLQAAIYRAAASGQYRDALAGMNGVGEQLEQQGGGESLVGDDVRRRAEEDLAGIKAKTDAIGTSFIDLKAIGVDALQSILDVRRFEDFGQVGSLILDTLKRKFLELAIVNPLTNLLTGATGADALPTIFGLFRGGRASGDQYFGGGLAVVGEFGPELAAMPRGTRITPAAQTRRMLEGAGDRGAVTNVYDLRGAIVEEQLFNRLQQSSDAAAVRGAVGGAALTQVQLRRRARYSMAGR